MSILNNSPLNVAIENPEFTVNLRNIKEARTSDTSLTSTHKCAKKPKIKAKTPVIFSIDWLSITIWNDGVTLTHFLRELGIDRNSLVYRHKGNKGFRESYGTHNGGLVNFEPILPGATFVQVVLPGNFCDTIDYEIISNALNILYDDGVRFNVSRLDIALDTQAFHPRKVTGAIKKGDIKTAVHKDSFDIYQNEFTNSYTQEVGSRASDKFLRIYHKQEENRFNNEWFTRCELELKDDIAMIAALDLLAAGTIGIAAITARAVALLRGFFEVTKKWWDTAWGNISAVKLVARRIATTLVSLSNWITKQVTPSLGVWVEIFGVDALRDELQLAKHRRTSKHQLVLNEAQLMPW